MVPEIISAPLLFPSSSVRLQEGTKRMALEEALPLFLSEIEKGL